MLAEQESRDIPAQAAHIVRQELIRRGFIELKSSKKYISQREREETYESE
jgi:hypothetical protein